MSEAPAQDGATTTRELAVDWAWRLAPVWTALSALLLDLLLLGRQSLRADEAQAVTAASGSWGDLWEQIRGQQSPDAAYDGLLKVWIAIAGSDEWTVRLPAALCGALAVGLTCALGARLYGRLAGVVAAGVLATSVVVVEWSQRGQPATLALVAAVAATLALVAAAERPAWWRWALWGVAAAVAVAASLVGVAVLAAHAVALLVRRPAPAWQAPVIAAIPAVLVGSASLVIVLASDARHVGGLRLPGGLDTLDGLWRLSGETAVPLALAGLGLFALVTRRTSGAETWTTVLLGAWLLAPVAAGLLVSLARPAFEPGHALAALPALALLAAAGVVSQREWQQWVALGLVGLLLAGAAFRLGQWYTGPSTEDWRGAVSAIREEQRAGEAVVVLPRRQAPAVAYYAGDGYTIDRARGHRVWLLLAVDDADRRLRLARRLVRPPRYALLEERRYGDRVWLQVWAEP